MKDEKEQPNRPPEQTRSPMLDLPPKEFWLRVDAMKRAIAKEIKKREELKGENK